MPSAAKAPSGSHTQAVRFAKPKWKVAAAKKWLKDHKFKAGAVDETPNELRFRQYEPDDSRFRYRYKSLGGGISLVVAFPKSSKAKSFRGMMDLNEIVAQSQVNEQAEQAELDRLAEEHRDEELVTKGTTGSSVIGGFIQAVKAPRVRKRTDPADMNARIREMK